MNTEQFIKDAIAAGWKWVNFYDYNAEEILGDYDFSLEETLLDPKFWQAVGKTRGWNRAFGCPLCGDDAYPSPEPWQEKLIRFAEFIADGLSIEEALGKL